MAKDSPRGLNGQAAASIQPRRAADHGPPGASGRARCVYAGEAGARDLRGFEQLLGHQAALLDYARRHIPCDLRGEIGPEDIVQDTFLEAFRRWDRFAAAGPDAARHWLTTIAKHQIANTREAHWAVKRGGKPAATGRRPGDTRKGRDLDELAVDPRTPEKSATAGEAHAALELSISRLPPDQQRVIRLRLAGNEGIEAAATALGRSRGAVRMISSRALKALRRDLRRRIGDG